MKEKTYPHHESPEQGKLPKIVNVEFSGDDIAFMETILGELSPNVLREFIREAFIEAGNQEGLKESTTH